jgi:hypothetical protein
MKCPAKTLRRASKESLLKTLADTLTEIVAPTSFTARLDFSQALTAIAGSRRLVAILQDSIQKTIKALADTLTALVAPTSAKAMYVSSVSNATSWSHPHDAPAELPLAQRRFWRLFRMVPEISIHFQPPRRRASTIIGTAFGPEGDTK